MLRASIPNFNAAGFVNAGHRAMLAQAELAAAGSGGGGGGGGGGGAAAAREAGLVMLGTNWDGAWTRESTPGRRHAAAARAAAAAPAVARWARLPDGC